MNQKMTVVVVIIVIASVGIPLAAKLLMPGGSGQPGASQTARPAGPAPNAGKTPGEKAGVNLPPASAPPLLNSGNLTNTTWQMDVEKLGAVTVQLLPNGVASVTAPALPSSVQGTWAVDGAVLTVSSMGKSVPAQITGDQIVSNGKPAVRVK